MLGPDGAFTYCNAGHNAPLLVSGNEIRRLETGGVVLGLFEHASFEEESLVLKPGDLIIAFSDGVTEALDPAGEEFTDDRLLACARAHLGESPQQVLDALLADVRTFCADATQSDDVTVVMVKYNGST
jgi:sigma-B regulation protein RsbU (phosphoserine phosphatase)